MPLFTPLRLGVTGPTCLCLWLSLCLSVHVSLYLSSSVYYIDSSLSSSSDFLSLCSCCLSLSVGMCHFLYGCVCVFVCVHVFLNLFHLSLCSERVSECLCINDSLVMSCCLCLSACVSFCVSVYLSKCLCCLSACLFFRLSVFLSVRPV